MASYDGIFFDSGGTIFGTGPAGGSGDPDMAQVADEAPARLAAALTWLGHSVPTEAVAQQLEAAQARRPQSGAYTEEDRVRAVFEGLDLSTRDDEVVYATGVYSGPRYRSWVFPGVAETMEQLAAAGLPMGLIANTVVPGWIMDRHFRGIGILHHLPVRVYSGDEGVEKPDAEIFRRAEGRAGLQGKRLVYMGDLVAKDIVGAGGVGWTTVLFRSAADTSDGAADYEIDSWSELPAILGID
jgi:FMN phosphatase YigB (HAD superfamily)